MTSTDRPHRLTPVAEVTAECHHNAFNSRAEPEDTGEKGHACTPGRSSRGNSGDVGGNDGGSFLPVSVATLGLQTQ